MNINVRYMMFKNCLLVLTIITSTLISNKNYQGYLVAKNYLYQEYKSICFNQTYYLKKINKPCFNYTNIELLFINKVNEFTNLKIVSINYVKEDSYIYPTYTQQIEYILNFEVGLKNYKFELISSLNWKGKYEI